MALNETLLPLFNQIDLLVNTFKVLVGGVFGIYLISVIIRWREYVMMKTKLEDIEENLRLIAARQKIALPPPRKTKLYKFWEDLKCQVRK